MYAAGTMVVVVMMNVCEQKLYNFIANNIYTISMST